MTHLTAPAHRHDTGAPSGRAAGRQRQKVLELLREANRPVDIQVVADALQIHVTTARFHLTALEAQSYVRRGSTRSIGAGRPKLTYELAPRLDYAEIVSLFAAHLGRTSQEREHRSRRIGADLTHRMHLDRPREETSVTDLVVATLSELGFQIRSVLASFGEVTVQLCTCPLAEVAQTAPEVVRGIQQGLIQAVVDLNVQAIGRSYSVVVTPDPDAGSCAVRLALRQNKTDNRTERPDSRTERTPNVEAVSLSYVGDEQLAAARNARAGRAGHTVYGGQQHALRQTVLALTEGHRLDDHENPGEATLLVLRGRVRLGTSAEVVDGGEGDYLVIPRERHKLAALEDSVVLLTVVTRS